MNVGEALFDRALGTPEYREARSVLRSYEQNQISAVAERGMQMRHLAEAALCIPKLALEVLIDGIVSTTMSMLVPLTACAAVVAIAEVLGLRIVAMAITNAVMSIYGFVTRLVVDALIAASGPVLLATGIAMAVGVGMARQLIGEPTLTAARDFRNHLQWAWDPASAARADYAEHRARCWGRGGTALTLAVGVAVLVALGSLRLGFGGYHHHQGTSWLSSYIGRGF